MNFIADLHLHSYLSRATSSASNLENYAAWAKLKGIKLLSTGDFTHPKWLKEITDKLVEAEPGFYKFKEDIALEIAPGMVVDTCGIRFILSVEISNIYRKGDRVRKVHNLVFVPNLEAARDLNARLSRIGNLCSDGRPILGLDSKSLLEIVLEVSEAAFLIPAHIWTPWFSILGSKSGFDAMSDCFEELTPHIFAVETGLSSDPEMNWRLTQLDRFSLVSNSDAHSPMKLGREANLFDIELSYLNLRAALKSGQGFLGTIEFFPEEGKYHLDGHRKCQVCLEPAVTWQKNGVCPYCGKPLTVGVLNRVETLADRPKGQKPKAAKTYHSLVPLLEILGEIHQVKAGSRRVLRQYMGLMRKFPSEFELLLRTDLAEIKAKTDSLFCEAIARLRQGRVIRTAGYDGEYGRISLFEKGELGPNSRRK